MPRWPELGKGAGFQEAGVRGAELVLHVTGSCLLYPQEPGGLVTRFPFKCIPLAAVNRGTRGRSLRLWRDQRLLLIRSLLESGAGGAHASAGCSRGDREAWEGWRKDSKPRLALAPALAEDLGTSGPSKA